MRFDRHLSKAAAFLVTYAAVPALLAWFTVVLATGVGTLVQDTIRVPTPSIYDPYLDDFVVFHSAGRMVAGGSAAHVYELEAIHDAEARALGVSSGDILVLPFFGAPHTVLPLAAVGRFDLAAGAVMWTASGLLVFCAGGALLVASRRRQITPAGVLLLAAGTASSMPFVQILIHGQLTLFLATGWMLLWLGAFRETRGRLAAVGLVVLATKPPLLAIPVAHLVLTRQWPTLLRSTGALAILTGAAISVAGIDLLTDYVRLLAGAATWDEENGISTWGMFGWNAFARALLGADATSSRLLLTLTLDAFTLAVIARVAPQLMARGLREEVFAIVVFGSLLISPHVYAHDLVFAAVPILLFVTCERASVRNAWAIYAVIGWFVAYFHFDVLAPTGVNFGALWLAGGVGLAASSLWMFPVLPQTLGLPVSRQLASFKREAENPWS